MISERFFPRTVEEEMPSVPATEEGNGIRQRQEPAMHHNLEKVSEDTDSRCLLPLANVET